MPMNGEEGEPVEDPKNVSPGMFLYKLAFVVPETILSEISVEWSFLVPNR